MEEKRITDPFHFSWLFPSHSPSTPKAESPTRSPIRLRLQRLQHVHRTRRFQIRFLLYTLGCSDGETFGSSSDYTSQSTAAFLRIGRHLSLHARSENGNNGPIHFALRMMQFPSKRRIIGPVLLKNVVICTLTAFGCSHKTNVVQQTLHLQLISSQFLHLHVHLVNLPLILVNLIIVLLLQIVLTTLILDVPLLHILLQLLQKLQFPHEHR